MLMSCVGASQIAPLDETIGQRTCVEKTTLNNATVEQMLAPPQVTKEYGSELGSKANLTTQLERQCLEPTLKVTRTSQAFPENCVVNESLQPPLVSTAIPLKNAASRKTNMLGNTLNTGEPAMKLNNNAIPQMGMETEKMTNWPTLRHDEIVHNGSKGIDRSQNLLQGNVPIHSKNQAFNLTQADMLYANPVGIERRETSTDPSESIISVIRSIPNDGRNMTKNANIIVEEQVYEPTAIASKTLDTKSVDISLTLPSETNAIGQKSFNLIDFIANNNSSTRCSEVMISNESCNSNRFAGRTFQDGLNVDVTNLDSMTLPLTPRGSCGSGYGLGLDVDEFLNSEDGQRM